MANSKGDPGVYELFTKQYRWRCTQVS